MFTKYKSHVVIMLYALVTKDKIFSRTVLLSLLVEVAIKEFDTARLTNI